MDVDHRALGRSGAYSPGTRVVIAGAGGRKHSVVSWIVAKQEFAGYWEYVLDDAIFTFPAHPNWGGTALIGPRGDGYVPDVARFSTTSAFPLRAPRHFERAVAYYAFTPR